MSWSVIKTHLSREEKKYKERKEMNKIYRYIHSVYIYLDVNVWNIHKMFFKKFVKCKCVPTLIKTPFFLLHRT